MVKATKKKNNNFDYEADWVPQKGRVFRMKQNTKEEERKEDPQSVFTPGSQDQRASKTPVFTPGSQDQRAKPQAAPQKLYTDSEGLDMAYSDQSSMFLDPQGTLFVSGTKGGFLGQEWIDNYKTMGAPLIQKMLGMPSDYSIEENERYQQIDEFVKAHPGQVKNMVGHSKGSAVVDVWMKNHPDSGGKSRLYATPYEHVFGKEEWNDRLNTFNTVRGAEYEGSSWKNPAEKWLEDKAVEKLTSFFWTGWGEEDEGEKRI